MAIHTVSQTQSQYQKANRTVTIIRYAAIHRPEHCMSPKKKKKKKEKEKENTAWIFYAPEGERSAFGVTYWDSVKRESLRDCWPH